MDSVLRGTLAMPEIDQIVALVNQSLSDLPDKVSQLQHTLAQGMRRTLLTTVDDDLLEQVYGRAYEHYQTKDIAKHYRWHCICRSATLEIFASCLWPA